MKRLLSAIKTDIKVQYRHNLYHIGAIISVLIAGATIALFDLKHFDFIFVALLLLIVGGSTLLYVGAIIIFEKDEGIIQASLVTPQPISEYLIAKIVSLTLLASFEACLILLILSTFSIVYVGLIPNITIFMPFSLIFICIIYVLIGMILVMPHKNITDYIMPMAGIIMLLQIPIFHFFDIFESDLFLILPISAPTLLALISSADFEIWQLFYSFGYSLLSIYFLYLAAHWRFKKHIMRGGT